MAVCTLMEGGCTLHLFKAVCLRFGTTETASSLLWRTKDSGVVWELFLLPISTLSCLAHERPAQEYIRGSHKRHLESVLSCRKAMASSFCVYLNANEWNVPVLLEAYYGRRLGCLPVPGSRKQSCQSNLTYSCSWARQGPRCFPYINRCQVSTDMVQIEPHILIWDKVTQTTCLEGNQGKYGSPGGEI